MRFAITIKQAASHCNVSELTIWKLIRQGLVKSHARHGQVILDGLIFKKQVVNDIKIITILEDGRRIDE